MRNTTRDRILERLSGELRDLIKGLMKRLMLEERAIYPEGHLTKANGYYTRDLLTLFGPIKELRVLGCEKGISIPNSSLTANAPPSKFLKRSFRFMPRG